MPGENRYSPASAKRPVGGLVEMTEGLITGENPLEILKGGLSAALLLIGINEAREALKPEPLSVEPG